MNITMETYREGWVRDLAEIFIPIAWLNRNSGAELLGKIADSVSGIDLSELKILESSNVRDKRKNKYFILSITKEEGANWGEITPILQAVIQNFFPERKISLKIREKHDCEDAHDGFIFVELIDNEDEDEICPLCGDPDCPGYRPDEDAEDIINPPCVL